MRKVLITGGCGFVGRWFANALLDAGDSVVIVDNISTGIYPRAWPFQPNDVRRMQFFAEDIRKFIREPWADRACAYDLIIHCAAVVGGRLKIDGDPLAVATDLAIDSDFFNWCVADRAHLPGKVVYFSSSAAYPTMLQKESSHCKLGETFLDFTVSKIGVPDQTYGWSKLSGEFLAQTAVKTYGLNVAIYRPFGGYGEDQSFDYPFPSIIRRALQKENPVTVWGSGEQQRDFIHIDDVVSGVLATLDLPAGTVLNLGTGIPTSFRQLAEQACVLAGYKPEIVNDATKPQGVFSRVANVYRLEQYYKPQISLETGIRRSLAFMREQGLTQRVS